MRSNACDPGNPGTRCSETPQRAPKTRSTLKVAFNGNFRGKCVCRIWAFAVLRIMRAAYAHNLP